MARPEHEEYKCPEQCGWFRRWNVDQARADELITHPLYGTIRNIDAARRDIAAHDCDSYREAVRRLHERDSSDGTEAADDIRQRQAGRAA